MPRFVIIDTETTGFVPKVHRVIEVAAVTAENGKVTEEFESLLSIPSDFEVPPAVQMLTRITLANLEGKPTFSDVQKKLESMCEKGTIIVGQNWPFDLSMLRGEGFDLTDHPWIDTSMIASLVFPEMPSYSLGYLSDALNLNHVPKHRALGDVHATYELLMKCIERLEELPAADMKKLQEVAKRSPEGYAQFFASLEGKGKSAPVWIKSVKQGARSTEDVMPLSLKPPKAGVVACVEEPLSDECVGRVIQGLESGTWFAVKNLDAVLRRWEMPKAVTVLREAGQMIDSKLQERFLAQENYTADEVMLAMKLCLYDVKGKFDLPIHGGEYQSFSAKLACTPESEEWLLEAKKAQKEPTILSHAELLRIARDTPDVLLKNLHVVIDDASMLEDTITQSEGWNCYIPTLRAAAAGDQELSQCTDTIELWAEKTRNDQSIRYLAPSDLQSRESSHLIELLQSMLTKDLQESVKHALSDLLKILDGDNLSNRFAWIEAMKDGSKSIQSVPDHVSDVLRDRLLERTRLTLLLPHQGEKFSDAYLGHDIPKVTDESAWSPTDIGLTFPIDARMDRMIENALGKNVLLVGSKRVIEDIFVRHSKAAEERGLTLICQGFSGGQGRMQAEFLEAKEDVLLVLTPWMYEGMDLAPKAVDTLFLSTLPFDHPSHAVIGRRALRYQNAFSQYSLPRLLNRLFRILRTFVSHANDDAACIVIDDRIRTKGYGKDVKTYLESLVGSENKKSSENTKGQLPLL